MNINLSSVSESPKATKGVASGSDGAEETSESGGFFAKLTAMIKGEGKAGGAFVSYGADEIVNGEPAWLEIVNWQGRFSYAKSALDAEALAFVGMVIVVWNRFSHSSSRQKGNLARTVA